MAVYVDGRRVITNAPGAVVRSKSKNYTNSKRDAVQEYDNICKSEDLINCSDNYFIDGYAVATIDSIFPQSYGDEGGSGGGVKSGTVNGFGRFISASKTTFTGFKDGRVRPIVREGDLVISNAGNCEPAPIEFTDGKTLAHHINKPEPTYSKQQSDFVHPIVLHTGNNNKEMSSNTFIVSCCYQKNEQYQYHALANCKEIESTSNSKCYYLPNQPNAAISRGLLQYQDFKYPFLSIPFTTPPIESQQKNSPKPPDNRQADQLVSLRLVNDYQLVNLPLTPDQEDYSDIFRLSDELRWRVYQFLIHNQLTKEAALLKSEKESDIQYPNWVKNANDIPLLKDLGENWYQLLPSSLKVMVDMELSRCIIRNLEDGWLYVFVDGHLWRECQIRHGNIHDVDLYHHANLEARPANGTAESALIVPYQWGGKIATVEVAFSLQQWGWPRINYYGGMLLENNQDIRRCPKDKGCSDEAAAQKARAQRFQKLNLTPLIDEKQRQVFDDNGAEQLFHEHGHYHLVIANPMRPIDKGARDIATLLEYLSDYLDEIANPLNSEYFQTAQLIYHYFFNKKDYKFHNAKTNKQIEQAFNEKQAKRRNLVTGRLTTQLAKMNNDGLLTESETEKELLQFDLDKVKATLKVDKRRRLRDLIRTLQKSLLALVQAKELDNIVSLSPTLRQSTRPDWHLAMVDILASDLESYAAAYGFFGMLCGVLDTNPSSLDWDHDIDHEVELNTVELTVSEQYLLSTFDKAHPLFKVLHPDDTALAAISQRSKKGNRFTTFKRDFADYQWHGLARFNHLLYAYLQAAPVELVGSIANSFSEGFSSYATASAKAIAKTINEQNKARHDDLVKLLFVDHLKAANLENATDPNFLSSDYGKSQAEFGTPQPQETARIKLTMPQFDQPVFINEAAATKSGLIIDYFPSRNALRQVVNQNLKASTLAQDKKLAKIKEMPEYRMMTRIGSPFPFYADRALSIMVLALSLYEVGCRIASIQRNKDKTGSYQKKEFLVAAADIANASYALEQVGRSFIGQDRVDSWWQSKSKRLESAMNTVQEEVGYAFTPLSLAATAVSMLHFCASLKGTYQAIKERSPQTLAANLINNGAKLGMVLNFIGNSFERGLEAHIKEAAKLIKASAPISLTERELNRLALDAATEKLEHHWLTRGLIKLSLPFANSWVGVGLLFADFMVSFFIEYMTDAPLLHWAKHTPFSKLQLEYSHSDASLTAEFYHALFNAPCPAKFSNQDGEGYITLYLPPWFNADGWQLKLHIMLGQYLGAPVTATSGFIGQPLYDITSDKSNYGPLINPSYCCCTLVKTEYDNKLNLQAATFKLDTSMAGDLHGNYQVKVKYQMIIDNEYLLPLQKNGESYLTAKQAKKLSDNEQTWFELPNSVLYLNPPPMLAPSR